MRRCLSLFSRRVVLGAEPESDTNTHVGYREQTFSKVASSVIDFFSLLLMYT
jgi:hypothetical protein